MALRREATIGVLWGVAERVAVQGISFVVILIIGRLLGPAEIGLVTIATTTILFGQTLLGETFSDALVQLDHLEPEHQSSVFWLLVGAASIASILVLAGAPLLASLFDQQSLTPILRALTPLLLLAAIQAVPIAQFRRSLDFRAIAKASSTGTFIGGVVGVAAAYYGFGVWSLVDSQLVQGAMICFSICRASSFRPMRSFSRRHFGELWSYGRYTVLMRISGFSANQGPRLLIGYLFGTKALGIFALSLRIIETFVQFLGQPAANVAIPVIARLRNDPVKRNQAIISASQLSTLICAPTFTCLAVLAPYAVPLLFGAKWQSSIEITQILAMWGIVISCSLIWISIIRGLGRQDISLKLTATGAITSLLSLAIFSPWGFHVAAIIYVVRGYGTLIACPLILKRLTGISAYEQYCALMPILLASLGMGLFVQLEITALHNTLSPLSLMVSALPVAALSYAGLLYLLARPTLRLGYSMFNQLRAKPS